MNNKNVIDAISLKICRHNKLRNLFAILGIVLTTILFTCIFSVSGSWISSMRLSQFKQIGTAAHGEFKYLTKEQYETISTNSLIQNIGSSQVLGMVAVPGDHSYIAELRCDSNDWVADISFSFPEVGRLPKNENEIALDSIMLDYLGAEHKVGERVEITFYVSNEKKTDTFILSGYWEGNRVAPASEVLVSKEYADKLMASTKIESDDQITGTYNAQVMFKQKKDITSQFLQVITESGYKPENIRFGVNPVYQSKIDKIDPFSALIAITIVGIIIVCGYLIISNIFSISIVNDIHDYALYKVIGTTNKQLRRIVKKQALFLCLIGIPMGVLVGYGISCVVTPYTFRMLSTSITKISTNPMIFVLTALFSMITVYISIHKSIKMVSNVSPIVALRSNEVSIDNPKKNQRRILKQGKLNVIRLAFANVFRYKKKTFKVILSITFSLILLNISYALANNFDMDSYIANHITCDYMVASSNYFISNKMYTEEGILSEERAAELSHFIGIENYGRVYFSELRYSDHRLDERFAALQAEQNIPDYYKNVLEGGKGKESLDIHLYGIDESIYDELNVVGAGFDKKLFNSGDYILVSSFEGNRELSVYSPGEIINLCNERGETKEYKILGIANVPSRLDAGHVHMPNPEFILPTDEYRNFTNNTAPMIITFNIEDEKEGAFEKQLTAYCDNASNLEYVSKDYYKEMFNKDREMFVVIGLTLSIILGLIGIANYLNSMITSIITRRREFALMSCVGMTSNQLTFMVIAEGFIYMMITVMFTLTFGLVIEKGALCFVSRVFEYISDTMQIKAILFCVPILAILAIIVPYAAFNATKEKSAIEKLLASD